MPSRQTMRTCLSSVSLGVAGMSQFRSTLTFSYPYKRDSHVLSEQKAHDLSETVVPTINVSTPPNVFVLLIIRSLSRSCFEPRPIWLVSNISSRLCLPSGCDNSPTAPSVPISSTYSRVACRLRRVWIYSRPARLSHMAVSSIMSSQSARPVCVDPFRVWVNLSSVCARSSVAHDFITMSLPPTATMLSKSAFC